MQTKEKSHQGNLWRFFGFEFNESVVYASKEKSMTGEDLSKHNIYKVEKLQNNVVAH